MASALRRKIREACFCSAVLFCLSQSALADLPLDIEGLLTDKGKFKLDLGLTYVNINRSSVATGEPILIQIGQTQFVSLPTQIGEARVNSDTLIPSLGLRYGLTSNTEVYGKTSWISDHARSTNVNGYETTSNNQFNDVWLGLNHRFIDEGNLPALLGFIEGAVAERQTQSTSYGKSWLIGATTYRSLDPVVLAMTAAYQYRLHRQDGNSIYYPGHLFMLNPQVSFAANDKVTLSSGLTWRHQGASRSNTPLGTTQSQRNTATTLNLGLAYLWDRRTMINLNSRSEVSGKNSTEISLAVQIKLGGLPAAVSTTPSKK